jgi:hypothetical protein
MHCFSTVTIEPNERESLLIFKLTNQDEKMKIHYMLEAY